MAPTTPPPISPEVQLQMTQEITSKQNISIFFPDVLKHIWKEDKERNWSVYSVEQSRYFWDRRETPK